MTNNEKFILCIEDDEDTCELIDFVFKQAGFRVTTFDAQSWSNLKQENYYSAVTLDNHFGDVSGIEMCRRIRRLQPEIPIVFFSGDSRQSEILKALDAGATLYLVKPLDFEKLVPATIELIK